MALLVLLGGARSGKSRLAVKLALETASPVTIIVTGEGRDDEMTARIAAHRAERPPGWEAVEEPHALEQAVAAVPFDRVLLVDCLSLWVANALERGDDGDTIEAAAAASARLAAQRSKLTIVVSNEVGLGLVPPTPLGRMYRDLLGSVNSTFVDASHEAALVVAGRRLALTELTVPDGS
jgi:adenosyl cobinamide kinase/adenosyl cobinamide phosphate guanylyltransferase